MLGIRVTRIERRMRACNNALQAPIDMHDGVVAHSPSVQATKDPTAIRSLIVAWKRGSSGNAMHPLRISTSVKSGIVGRDG